MITTRNLSKTFDKIEALRSVTRRSKRDPIWFDRLERRREIHLFTAVAGIYKPMADVSR
jgi:hypothetical protein